MNPAEERGGVGERGGVFALHVDEGGQFLVCTGDRIRIGHVRAARAELLFLADVEAEHAVLTRTESLRGGSGWRIAGQGDAPVRLDGAAVPPSGAVLGGRSSIELANNLHLRHAVPDPASRTTALDIVRGPECAGAQRIFLMAEGAAGRLVVSGAKTAHVPVASFPEELVIELGAEGLELTCDAGVRKVGEAAAESIRLECPPTTRVDLLVGESRPGAPPCVVTLAPADRSGGGGP